MKLLLKDKRLLVLGLFMVFLIVLAVLAPLVSPYSPREMRSDSRLLPPGSEFLLGTDTFGRDILSRLIWGTRITMFVSIGTVVIAGVGGIVLGLSAGYFGGWADIVIMRTMDAMLTFPPIVLAIFVVAFIGSSLINVTAVIGFLNVPRFARIAYGSTISVKENEYVEAMRALGAPTLRILRKAILPNIAAPIFVQASLTMGAAILVESGLSFLGLGPPPSIASWGRMIEQSYKFMHLSAWTIIWPAIMISITVVAFNIFGDALRDSLDPRLRQ